jgi:hypothetical protein
MVNFLGWCVIVYFSLACLGNVMGAWQEINDREHAAKRGTKLHP